jgi:hypothetical protein
MTTLKINLLGICLLTASACSTISDAMVKTNTGNSYSSQKPTPTEIAICEGRTEIAKALARGDNNFSAKEQFINAYALELQGHPVRAKAIYMSLSNNDKDTQSEHLSLRCDGIVHYDSPLTDLVLSRISTINAKLLAMDAVFSGETEPSHTGLKSSKLSNKVIKVANARVPNTEKAPPQPAKSITPIAPSPKIDAANPFFKPLTVTLPESIDREGKWFAHIASYRTQENATAYLGTLEGKYPALAGNIESWQASTNNGITWRLGVRVSEWSDADRLCVIIRSKNDYCRVIDTAQ